MTLHVFNPEHDIALAANLSNFTAPHAGRQLRHDLGFLPALWAKEDDVVLVDDVELAEWAYQRFSNAVHRHVGSSLLRSKPVFAPWKPVVSTVQTVIVDPWGWDVALKTRLQRIGVGEPLLPTDVSLDAIRQLSHRRVSVRLLPMLQQAGTIGEAFECHNAEDVLTLIDRYDRMVLKAPWSSSGRGLRFVSRESLASSNVAGWLRNLLSVQGSVIAEPYYNKVKDFGMEFTCTASGEVLYDGLSLFQTANGAYTGNILATESVKQGMISRYVSADLLDDVRRNVCSRLAPLLAGNYTGPFGIDMMIVSHHEGLLLHPCVEINMRRTMGHAALAISPTDDDIVRVMRIETRKASGRCPSAAGACRWRRDHSLQVVVPPTSRR